MRKVALFGAIIAVVFAASAQAAPEHRTSMMASACGRYQAFTVINQVHVPTRFLAKVERAVEDQSAEVRTYWHSPCAVFVQSGGWPVYLTWALAAFCSGLDGSLGCHGSSDATLSGTPTAWVSIAGAGDAPSWTVTFSHEVLESLVDPLDRRTIDGDVLEICDPVSTLAYRLDGVWVSDFTLPADWRFPLPLYAAMDEMRVL